MIVICELWLALLEIGSIWICRDCGLTALGGYWIVTMNVYFFNRFMDRRRMGEFYGSDELEDLDNVDIGMAETRIVCRAVINDISDCFLDCG